MSDVILTSLMVTGFVAAMMLLIEMCMCSPAAGWSPCWRGAVRLVICWRRRLGRCRDASELSPRFLFTPTGCSRSERW